MFDATVTFAGYVGTEVEFHDGNGAPALAVFRLGFTPRWYDRGEGKWRDHETVWFTVKAWRSLAHNVKASVRRGEPVIVHGKLRARKWQDEQTGEDNYRMAIEADIVGHDLTRGTTAFLRTERPAATRTDDAGEELTRKVEAVAPELARSPAA